MSTFILFLSLDAFWRDFLSEFHKFASEPISCFSRPPPIAKQSGLIAAMGKQKPHARTAITKSPARQGFFVPQIPPPEATKQEVCAEGAQSDSAQAASNTILRFRNCVALVDTRSGSPVVRNALRVPDPTRSGCRFR